MEQREQHYVEFDRKSLERQRTSNVLGRVSLLSALEHCNEQTNSMHRNPSSGAKYLPASTQTKRFISVFTLARHWSLH